MGAAEQRAAALAQRSTADEAAELGPASAAVSAALGALSHGASESCEPAFLNLKSRLFGLSGLSGRSDTFNVASCPGM